MHFTLDIEKKRLPTIIAYLEGVTGEKLVSIDEPTRTALQNKLYWANIEILATHSGYTKEEMNCTIKKSITIAEPLNMWHEKKGKITVDVYRSTSKLDKKEWIILMEYIYSLGKLLKLQMKYPDNGLIEFAESLFNQDYAKM